MRILTKVMRFIFVFFVFSIVLAVIRDLRIPILVYLWVLVIGYYALWEFGFLQKKGKTGSQKNKGGKNE